MQSLTVDDALAPAMRQVKELAEVRDGQGNLIGFFAPVSLEHAARYAQAAAAADPLAAKQPKNNGPAATTAEVLERLRSLEPRYGMGHVLHRRIAER